MDQGVVDFCRNFSKISGISSVTTPIFWPAVSPVTPFGGIVSGLSQRTNVVIDLCDFVLSFEEWNTSQKINGSKRFLNDLTGRKHQEDFDMFDSTFNLAESVYDFDSGEQRKGGLQGEQAAREMNQYLKDLNVYIANKQMTEAEKKRNDTRYSTEIQQFTDLVVKDANISEATRCPDASSNPKYKELYDKEIVPEEQILKDASADQDFYREKLYELGQFMFNGDYESFSRFKYDTDRLPIMGTNLEVKKSSYNEETFKPGKRFDPKGRPIPEKKLIVKNYQIFNAKVYDEVLNSYKSKYNSKWQEAVRLEYLTKSTQYGVFAGASERVEKTFRNFNYECSEKKLMFGFDPNKPTYDIEYEKRKNECEASNTSSEKKEENLFQFYASNFFSSIYKEKKSLAKIWTFESKYLGTTRVVLDNPTSGFQSENAKCANNLSEADMKKLAVMQKDIQTKYKEIIAKNKIKKNIRKENEKNQRVKEDKEYLRRKELIDNRNKELYKQDRINTGISPPKGGIGQ